MRKGVLIFGAFYVTLGFWLFLTFNRLNFLYQEFGEAGPSHLLYFSIGVLFFGFVQLIIYFRKFNNNKIYKTIFIIDLLLVVLFSAYYLVAGVVSERQMSAFLEMAL